MHTKRRKNEYTVGNLKKETKMFVSEPRPSRCYSLTSNNQVLGWSSKIVFFVSEWDGGQISRSRFFCADHQRSFREKGHSHSQLSADLLMISWPNSWRVDVNFVCEKNKCLEMYICHADNRTLQADIKVQRNHVSLYMICPCGQTRSCNKDGHANFIC